MIFLISLIKAINKETPPLPPNLPIPCVSVHIYSAFFAMAVDELSLLLSKANLLLYWILVPSAYLKNFTLSTFCLELPVSLSNRSFPILCNMLFYLLS